MSTELAQAKASIDRADIRRLVDRFYSRIRADDRLGPIFAAHVGTAQEDWDPHIAKIEAFWANVMLNERAYRGNPMLAHQGISEMEGADFAIWLDLFARTATDVLPAEKAAIFDTLARRIGRSLKMGIERVAAGGPPNLSA